MNISPRCNILTNQTDIKNLAVYDSGAFKFRSLVPTDGMALHNLVRACPPLDANSSYCNLLHSSHFHATSVAAILDGELVGGVTGYRIPDRADTLFIWQVAVHVRARGKGLAKAMLHHLLERMLPKGVRFIETSITHDNEASQKLFSRFANEYHTQMLRSVMFDKESHFEGAHETEYLFRLGPFKVTNT